MKRETDGLFPISEYQRLFEKKLFRKNNGFVNNP